MPLLNDSNFDSINLPNSHYGYSGARLESLGASEYTIATIVCDVSGSTSGFTFDMEAAITQIVQACKLSLRSDNLLLRLVQFDDKLEEIHGFKMLENCNLADYGGSLRSGGSTALYDATENAISAAIDYGRRLTDAGFSANAILFVMTDGADNASKLKADHVKKALRKAVTSEAIESIISILIGVNVQDNQISKFLKSFYKDAGFSQYIEIDKADSQTLARLACFVSQSIYSQSVVLGTGGPSQLLKF